MAVADCAGVFNDIPDSVIQRIPIVLLTGFLGSGKTTLIRALLRSRQLSETAVLVNEYGKVGLDHTLMWRAGEIVEVVENGCICCGINEDLISVLEELFELRLRRKIPKFQRVVIETTGLADPRPIVQALRFHPLMRERFRLAAVLCSVDADCSPDVLLSSPESLAQITSADRVFLTKTDLVGSHRVADWSSQLGSVNPAADIVSLRDDDFPDDLPALFEQVEHRPSYPPVARVFAPRATGLLGSGGWPPARGHPTIQTATVLFPEEVNEQLLFQALHELAIHLGDNLLRLKGVVRLRGKPLPSVIQGVRSRIFPLEHLKDYDAEGFLVIIIRGSKADIAWAISTVARADAFAITA